MPSWVPALYAPDRLLRSPIAGKLHESVVDLVGLHALALKPRLMEVLAKGLPEATPVL